MFKHILIATDGSELAELAADQGLELAKVLKANVTAVIATEPWVAVVAGDAACKDAVQELIDTQDRLEVMTGSLPTKQIVCDKSPGRAVR